MVKRFDPFGNLAGSALSKIIEEQDRINKVLSLSERYENLGGILGVSDEIKKLIERDRAIQDIVYPINLTSEYIEKIAGINSVSQRIFDDQYWLNSASASVASLDAFRYKINEIDAVAGRVGLWQEAIAIQKRHGVPDYIADAISGMHLDQSIFNGYLLGSDLARVNEISLLLGQEHIFCGEFDLEDTDDEESTIILPDEFEKRFETVNFFPIRVFQKIMNDPNVMREIDPRDFEFFVAELIEKLGFENIKVTPRSGDGGRDIIATREVNQIPMLFAFECKKYASSNKIQMDTMRALLGAISHGPTKANVGVLVTTSSFTSGARKFIAAETLLDGKDFNDLVKWINQVKSK